MLLHIFSFMGILGAIIIYLFYLNNILNIKLQQKILDEQQHLMDKRLLERQITDYEVLIANREERLREHFSNLSKEALNTQTDVFLKRMDLFFQQAHNKQQDQSLNFLKLMEPIVTSMDHYKEQTINMEQERHLSHQLLHQSLDRMNNMYCSLKEHICLLTSSGKMGGKWGEIQLKRILEFTGLLPHCDFLEQYHMAREEGNLRPDILINLPDNIYVTIDAKTSLTSYMKYKEALNDEDRKKYRKEYYKCIKNHISILGSKKYWSQFKTSPEMVIMFLPGEDFWSLALEEDGEIMEYAYNMNVIVSTPLTLIPLLRIIALLWSKYKLSEESEELKTQTIVLYDQFTKINQIIKNMSRDFNNLHENYNKINYLQNNMTINLDQLRDKYLSHGKK